MRPICVGAKLKTRRSATQIIERAFPERRLVHTEGRRDVRTSLAHKGCQLFFKTVNLDRIFLDAQFATKFAQRLGVQDEGGPSHIFGLHPDMIQHGCAETS